MSAKHPDSLGWYRAKLIEPHRCMKLPNGRPVEISRTVCLEVQKGVHGLNIPSFYGKRIAWGEKIMEVV